MIYKNIIIKDYEIITKKVYDYVVNKTSIIQERAVWNNLPIDDVMSCIPELTTAFEEMGDLVPKQITIFRVEPKEYISIHTDGDGTHARLLWPIKNCEGSYTKFFKVDERHIEKRTSFGPEHEKRIFGHITSLENVTLLESVELIHPIVFKPWIPHGIWTNPLCDEPRLTLTISFNKSLEYMLV